MSNDRTTVDTTIDNWTIDDTRSQTRLMPFSERKRVFDLVLACLIEERTGDARTGDALATVGETITAEEFETLTAAFHLVITADGEYRDALQG